MKFLTRKLVTPADLNPRGYLHGGQLLKWIDEEGGIHAGLELETGLIVTKYISEIDFKFPVIQGDVVEIGMQTVEIGKTSCTLTCQVRSLQAGKIVCSIDNIDGFKASKDYMFEDVVFGWWGDTYIKVEKDSYEKYIDEIQKRK